MSGMEKCILPAGCLCGLLACWLDFLCGADYIPAEALKTRLLPVRVSLS